MKKLEDPSPLLPPRGGHLLLAALTAFMGTYHLWIGASGLYTGSIWVFTKHSAALASRAAEPVWFWANVAGRAFLVVLLVGIAIACVAKASSASTKE